LDPAPSLKFGSLLAACLPAIFCAAFATASSTVAALSAARRAALRETLEGSAQRALDRYLENGPAIEARWLVLRSFGVAYSAMLLHERLPLELNGWRALVAGLVAVLAYAGPSEMARSLATRDPERAAPLLLQLLRPIELLATPISAPVVGVGQLIARWFAPVTTRAPGVTETEVEMIVNEGELNGSLAHEQSEMIRNVLEFGDVTAADVMVPRTMVTSFDVETDLAQVLERIRDSGHSRYPVYAGSIDNVVGLLYAKDLLTAARGDVERRTLAGLLRTPVAFVPESQTGSSVLKDMRAGRHHMAIVIDEFGGMSGILTLEDLLEKIVGDIRDEHDREEPPIVDLGNGRLAVDASVAVTDLSRYLGAELPHDGDYHSLGGFITAQLGRVPEIGAQLAAYGLQFEVREADERKVSKVEITRLAPPESIAPRSSSRISAA